jgi:hypothetical protein
MRGALFMRSGPAAILLALLAGAAPVRGEEPKPVSPIKLEPSVQLKDDHVAVTVQGRAVLPDGTKLQILLVPIAAAGESVTPLQTSYAEVKSGAFAASPWRVKRSDLKAALYRVEARVAPVADQLRELQRALQKYRGGVATADLPLDSWRERCRRLTPQAQVLLDRLSVLTRQRDAILAMAKLALSKQLTAAQWKAWSGRSGFSQARARCVETLNDPLSVSLLPRSCDKGIYVVSVFDGIVGSIQQVLPGGGGEENPEFRAILSIAEQETPPDYLLEFQRVLAREGAWQYAGMLRDAIAELDPGTLEKPRQPAPDRLAIAQRDVRLVFDQITLFFNLSWAAEAVGPRMALLDAVEGASRLLDESSGAGAADAHGRRLTLWSDLKTKLDRMQVSLR